LLSPSTDLTLPYLLSISMNSIAIDKLLSPLDPIRLRFNCDFEEQLPCSVNQF
jgi:hypothetical protein